MRQTCIFSGSSHPLLVDAICERLGCKQANVDLKKFSNGETSVEIKTSVRDQDVYIVQSGSGQINDNVMELLIMINACKGGSSKSITANPPTAVMPYFPYSRQSKKKSHRGAITARMLANLMNVAGVTHVITVDLHASQMQGFFKCPVDNLVAEPLLSKWIRTSIPNWRDGVAVSKNPGGTKRVTSLADSLKLSFGIVTTDRRRPRMPHSMYGSAVLESMGTDGTNDPHGFPIVSDEAERRTFPYERNGGHAPIEHDFARPPATSYRVGSGGEHTPERLGHGRSWAGTGALHSVPRTRMPNGYGEAPMAPSPLSRSTRPDSDGTVEASSLSKLQMGAPPCRDEDGYEEPENENDEDQRARDVTTGRLISGHIVDDDAPSPSISAVDSTLGNHSQRHSSDDEPPDQMLQSFMSTASSRFQPGPGQGLGGTGDATASDEEEEEALQNPEIESTVTLVGNVRNRPVFIIDDMIDKAGSWIAAAETVRKRGGATKVYCMATHGLFGGNSLRELDECDDIEAVVVTDAFPIPVEKRRGIRKLVVLDVSGLLAEAIRRNKHGESISQLYLHFD